MRPKQSIPYLISLPERSVRSTGALAGGILREFSEVVLPRSFRKTKLYLSLVETTLRFMIEQIGNVPRSSLDSPDLPADFVLRRSAGNGIEMLGILLFRLSPVWVLAALSDFSSASRVIIREVAECLQEKGLLEKDADFQTLDQILNGLEHTSGRLVDNLNTPPFDVQTLRNEWATLKREIGSIPLVQHPSAERVSSSWQELKAEAAAQGCSVFELSSLMALAVVKGLPKKAFWLSQCATLAAQKTGSLMANHLLDSYSATLHEVRRSGYLHYWVRELRPYLQAAASNFSPEEVSYTERFVLWCLSRTPAVPLNETASKHPPNS